MWLKIIMVVVWCLVFVAICAQWIAYVVVFWSWMWATPNMLHHDDLAGSVKPSIISRVCWEWNCASFMEHVRVRSSRSK